jgi:quinol-cytochrome oxidoreductase complex cytochrome b subunit
MRVIILHLHILHEYVSGSSVGRRLGDVFSSWYRKDLITICLSVVGMLLIIIAVAVLFMDADNWAHCDPMKTPEHIKPE